MLSQMQQWFSRIGRRPPQRVMIFGDSHTVAIAQALAYREGNPNPVIPKVELYRLLKSKGGTQLGDTSLDEFCKLVAKLRPSDAVFSAIGGNQYAVASTVRSPPYFDVVGRGAPLFVVKSDESIVPYRVLESYIASGVFNSDGPMLQKIREATPARVYHLTPPPPKYDNAFIKQFHETRFAAEGLGELEPHPPQLRMTCWKMQQESLRELCRGLGVDLLPPPDETFGSDGFLDPHYYGKDVTHANRRYGEQVLRQIAEVARLDGSAG